MRVSALYLEKGKPVGFLQHAVPLMLADSTTVRERFSWEREFRIWFDDDELLNRIEEPGATPAHCSQIWFAVCCLVALAHP
jgi:hypothetical protein